jgi:type II secretory pathway pseudopilin PulG
MNWWLSKLRARYGVRVDTIELLLAIALVLALMAVILPEWCATDYQSKVTACKANLIRIERAMASYHRQCGCWPESMADLTSGNPSGHGSGFLPGTKLGVGPICPISGSGYKLQPPSSDPRIGERLPGRTRISIQEHFAPGTDWRSARTHLPR